MALQLFMQSSGLLNQFLPSSSIPDKGLPIWHFWLMYVFSNIILPAYLWPSYWPSWNGFPGVYCLDHFCFLHPFDVTKPCLNAPPPPKKNFLGQNNFAYVFCLLCLKLTKFTHQHIEVQNNKTVRLKAMWNSKPNLMYFMYISRP